MAVQNDGQLDMGFFDSEVIENFVEEQQRKEEERIKRESFSLGKTVM
jgi:hypothetical protein